MELRDLGERRRDLNYDQSLKNPLYLQMNAVVREARRFFASISPVGLCIYDFGCGSKPYRHLAERNTYIGIDIDRSNKTADIYSNIDDVPVQDCAADIVWAPRKTLDRVRFW